MRGSASSMMPAATMRPAWRRWRRDIRRSCPGELFRAAGVRRDEVVVASKLWWEFRPPAKRRCRARGLLGADGFGLCGCDLRQSAAPGGCPHVLVKPIGRSWCSGEDEVDVVCGFDAAGAVCPDDAGDGVEEGLALSAPGRCQVGLNAG